MTQAGNDLFLGLGEAFLIVVVTALLFLLQDGDGHRHYGQGEEQERRAKDDAQAEGRQPGQRGFHWRRADGSDQRKPRMGMFSMPSKASSSSRKASRMVLMCLRMLSRLRPLFTTWKSSS